MSIIVHIYYSGRNGAARQFAKEMMESGTVEAIRKEEGNIGYAYYYPVEDEETVLLIDSWKDQESIDRHHASSMMKVITDLREKYDLHMKVQRYISDTSMPESDKAFIRK